MCITVSRVPYMPVVGNHENVDHFLPFTKRHSPPFAREELYWSVDYGMLHLIGLSSETPFGSDSPQYAWLEKDLKAINRSVTPWVVAGWHKYNSLNVVIPRQITFLSHRPWYCSNMKHFGEGEPMRQRLESMLLTYGVDVVIAGHVHVRTHWLLGPSNILVQAYERTVPMNHVGAKDDGIVHLTVGMAGTKEGLETHWHVPTPDWCV